ncbi:ABC transporter substrate-binding protein [Haladaptatus halobius]|uniref:ABC transporter substrate-binding protein n=1 Tax=Haladaptatus halobius TaxID=2884875 RepID=UPI001D0BAA59|nr:PotD/PotF family extracellular solute-binding protein [Haladaptatus halobius]
MSGHTSQSESDGETTSSGSDDREHNIQKRRTFLLSMAGASASLLAGCSGESSGDGGGSSGGSSGTTTDQSLKVAVWSGQYHTYFKNTIKRMYEEETGTTVKLVPGWSAIISKIKSAPEDDPPYDIAVTEGQMYNQAQAEDLFLKIRKENIPNLKKVYPYIKNLRSTKYGAPFDGAPVAVMYNNQKINYDINDWQTLIDNDTRLTMDGGFYAYTIHIAAIVADQMPGVEEIYNKQHHKVPFKRVKDFNTTSFYSTGAERWQQMQLRIANAAQTYFGVSMGRKADNDWISVTLPETTTGYYDHYGVVRGTDKREMAEHFLNFMLRTDVQNKWGKTSHQLLANKNAEHSQAAQEAGFPSTNQEYKDFHFPDYEYLSDYSDTFSRKFEKLKRS